MGPYFELKHLIIFYYFAKQRTNRKKYEKRKTIKLQWRGESLLLHLQF